MILRVRTRLATQSGAIFLSILLLLSPVLVSAQSTATPAAPTKTPAAKPAVPAAKAPAKELVGVLDLEGVGASKVETSAMTDRLREELLKTGKFILVDRSQMSAVLDEQALQQTGCTSQECAVQVGKVLGVRQLISGKVTKLSDTQWVVNVTVVDVETSETLRAESLPYKGDYFGMLNEGMGLLATKLSLPPGEKVDLAKYLAAQQGGGAQSKPEEEKSSSKWWWIAGGVAVLAAAAGGGKGGGGGGGGSANPCASGCGSVKGSW